jgi:hypothetical protein
MARKYPSELNEAIWGLMKLEMSGPQIRQKLANGDAGLKKPLRVGLRTVQMRMAKLSRERGAPEIPDQEVGEVATAVAHEILIAARRQIAMIPKNRLAKPQELASAEKLTRIVNELRRGPRPESTPSRRGGEHKHRSTTPPSLLERLAEQARTAESPLRPQPQGEREGRQDAARRSASAPEKPEPELDVAKPSVEHARNQQPASPQSSKASTTS